MRIVGGSHRGRALAGLAGGDPAAHLRPTTDRVRESLFNLLAHGSYGDPAPPEGCRVLDLFAGTGALGLEALSRGAEQVTFVENGNKALGILRQNVTKLNVTGQTSVITRDATRAAKSTFGAFNLVFLDPPYNRKLGERAITAALTGGWIADGALLVWEESHAPVAPGGLSVLDVRQYGDTSISIYRYTAP